MVSSEKNQRYSGKLSERSLNEHGIFFNTEIYQERSPEERSTDRIPTHVNRLRKILLDFTSILEPGDEKYVGEKVISEPHIIGIGRKNGQESTARRKKRLLKAAKKAKYHSGRHSAEDQWQRMLENSFFREIHADEDLDPLLPGPSFLKSAFDRYVIRGHRTRWTEATELRKGEAGPSLSIPVPDLFFAFNINETRRPEPNGEETYRSKEEGAKSRPCMLDDQYVNFNVEILKDLRGRGLISSPLKTLSRQGLKMAQADHICFPWLVVEIKPDHATKSGVDKLYCQAANGTSVALEMFTRLATHSRYKAFDGHIPPVISITFHGPKARVWLSYTIYDGRTKKREHKMRCIWAGAITTFWGCIQLECILDNAKAWATRILKPMISEYINDHVQFHKRMIAIGRERPRYNTDENSDRDDSYTEESDDEVEDDTEDEKDSDDQSEFSEDEYYDDFVDENEGTDEDEAEEVDIEELVDRALKKIDHDDTTWTRNDLTTIAAIMQEVLRGNDFSS